MADSPDAPQIDKSIYRYVLRHTWRGQLFLLALTVITMPLVYISLDIPKRIINQAIGGANLPDQLFGFEISQVGFLMFLSGAFLLAVVATGGLKYFVNVYKGVLGERMLRRFRFDLYSRILRFPSAHLRRTPSAEIIPMITAETEPLGGLIGDAIAAPAFQGALLLTYLSFIFQQDVWLGLASIALYPPQMYLIPKLQAKVNALSKTRVQNVRKLASHIGETVEGALDIHANDSGRFERAKASGHLGRIFDIREEIYRRKFFIKFLNNFLAQITPFFFFSIGGYLVIKGEVSLGALVAVLAAYKDIGPPWKELLKFYQVFEDTKVKYLQVAEQFEPNNLIDSALLEVSESPSSISGPLLGKNISYGAEDDIRTLKNIGFEFRLDQHVAMVGGPGSGKGDLSAVAARLVWPSGGELSMGGADWTMAPESTTGQRVAWVGTQAYIFSGTVAHNLYYGLFNAPTQTQQMKSEASQKHRIQEAIASGNSADDAEDTWLDLKAAGVASDGELMQRVADVLQATDLDGDVYRLGMSTRVDVGPITPDTAEKILQARDRLRGSGLEFSRFDAATYNTNLTVAENIIFGYPADATFSSENLPSNRLVSDLLKEVGLFEDFLKMGHRVAKAMLEIFSGIDAESELMQRFSLVSSDDLTVLEGIIRRCPEEDQAVLNGLPQEDQQMLKRLVYRLVPARHRLGIISEPIQHKLLEVRKRLAESLGTDNESVIFLRQDEVCRALSVEENVLFGTAPYGKPAVQKAIDQAIDAAIDTVGLRPFILSLGLEFNVGPSGNRLSQIQRQKLAFARGLLKNPDLLVVDEALGAFDFNARSRFVNTIRQFMKGRGILWALESPSLAEQFDQIIVMRSGNIVETGTSSDLLADHTEFSRLLSS